MRFGSHSKTCVNRLLSKRPQIGLHDQLSFNAGQKYCRMLQGEYSAILSTFIKLPFVIKIVVLSIFGWPFYTGFSVYHMRVAYALPKLSGSLEHLLFAYIKNGRR